MPGAVADGANGPIRRGIGFGIPRILQAAGPLVPRFRGYSIPRVGRGDYIALDRGELDYLNGIEALRDQLRTSGTMSDEHPFVRDIA